MTGGVGCPGSKDDIVIHGTLLGIDIKVVSRAETEEGTAQYCMGCTVQRSPPTIRRDTDPRTQCERQELSS